MGNLTEAEILEELIDEHDENLEASSEVEIPTRWTEQQTDQTVTVQVHEEEPNMVDMGQYDYEQG